jgi:hypothetical protein
MEMPETGRDLRMADAAETRADARNVGPWQAVGIGRDPSAADDLPDRIF